MTTVLMMSPGYESAAQASAQLHHLANLNNQVNGSWVGGTGTMESLVASSRNNTISQLHGDKTLTETTASVSNEDGCIGLQRQARHGDDDDLGLS